MWRPPCHFLLFLLLVLLLHKADPLRPREDSAAATRLLPPALVQLLVLRIYFGHDELRAPALLQHASPVHILGELELFVLGLVRVV